MALGIPKDQIDTTDERIVSIVCYGCLNRLWVEKGSDCHVYNRCTSCANELDRKIQVSRNDS